MQYRSRLAIMRMSRFLRHGDDGGYKYGRHIFGNMSEYVRLYPKRQVENRRNSVNVTLIDIASVRLRGGVHFEFN